MLATVRCHTLVHMARLDHPRITSRKADAVSRMTSNPVYICTVLATLVLAAEVLVTHTRLRVFGTALLVILLGAVSSNLGVIPTEASTPIYGHIFRYLAPLSIFWLLLQVNLRQILRAGTPMLMTFGLGALGTTLGVVAGGTLAGGVASFGAKHAALAGMFAGTYIGGSVNFNAIALEYGVVSDGAYYAGAVAVDNIVTALWMVACLAGPRLLAPLWPPPDRIPNVPPSVASDAEDNGSSGDSERLDPARLALVIAVGLGALLLRDAIVRLAAELGLEVPGMLVLTALAIALAQTPAAQKIHGARVVGMFSVFVFLAVIGALCSLSALAEAGRLGLHFAVLASVTVAVHGLVVLLGGRLLRVDLATISVASQANIGGATTALALARSLGRPDLVVPGILAGSLGTAAGTFVGFWLTSVLQ